MNSIQKTKIREIQEAAGIYYLGTTIGIGIKLWERYQEIAKKYPKEFPWETKYDSIPEEVHKAYREERWNTLYGPLLNNLGEGKEIMSDIVPYSPIDIRQEFQELLKGIENWDEKRRQESEEIEAIERQIWDLYYKKYNLPYRS